MNPSMCTIVHVFFECHYESFNVYHCPCVLQRGSFQHGNTEWHLEPLDRMRRQAGDGETHRLFPGPPPNAETISFVGDAIEDNERKFVGPAKKKKS